MSVLITDTVGRILLQRVTHRTMRLLPGGGVDTEAIDFVDPDEPSDLPCGAR
ncbi:NUDIX hydrolase [Streptomyces griseiscabiei]|uniref:NUDIX hydrolase n=1 Tax=Streptomyces griseiscabiei TaxID=2993540 RepID=A0ABU4KXY5_9ACTN|nr:hypothetical protein [Streptomyces griseiscabiei]MBZ3904503.1 hypothetical protein [Streptomyces griseiscabiei]MDX2908252.1 hypothetical protein [Streptomyces griseiscabiei]